LKPQNEANIVIPSCRACGVCPSLLYPGNGPVYKFLICLRGHIKGCHVLHVAEGNGLITPVIDHTLFLTYINCILIYRLKATTIMVGSVGTHVTCKLFSEYSS